MRNKVLKSNKYKQAVRDGTLDSKTLTIVPRKDYTLEEESRDIYQEIVEGFDALKQGYKGKWFVYFCYVDGILRYVGEGEANRWVHCNSGKSNCVELNRAYFEGKTIRVEVVHECSSKAEAVSLECAYITEYRHQLWNGYKGTAGKFNLKPNIELRQQRAKDFAKSLHGVFEGFRLRGLTQRQMVAELNQLGIKTARGGSWSLVQVQRVLKFYNT